MDTLEKIPDQLSAPVYEALNWINQQESEEFSLTGLEGTEIAMAAPAGEPFELGLILCSGEICARHDLRFIPSEKSYTFEFAQTEERQIPALLDPPLGIRSGWLDGVLQKHEFVLLLFYRGLW